MKGESDEADLSTVNRPKFTINTIQCAWVMWSTNDEEIIVRINLQDYLEHFISGTSMDQILVSVLEPYEKLYIKTT